jgi:hypothetical protein
MMLPLKRYILILLSFVLSLSAMAQQGSALRFATTTLDFGHINEVDGAERRSFEAQNVGSDVVTVLDIVSTCDCTVAQYTRCDVAPGELFTFDVVYDPTNRPGRFERTIFLYTSESEEPIELMIKGRVAPRERSVEELYPYDMGQGLRLDATFATFSYLEHGKEYSTEIAYANTSDSAVRLTLIPELSSGVLSVEYPEVLEPHSTGDIKFSYHLGEDSGVYGTLDERFAVEVDGVRSRFMVTSYGVAVDNFDSVDDILSPRADYSKKIIKFGDVNALSRSITHRLEITNSGLAPLYVRKVECDTEAVRVKLRMGRRIKPNKSCTLRVKLKPRALEGVEGSFVARLRIVTNDPTMPLQVVRLTANINRD